VSKNHYFDLDLSMTLTVYMKDTSPLGMNGKMCVSPVKIFEISQ